MEIQHPGIVLRRSEGRGSDLILKILTKDSGKIAVVARGARNSKKRFSGGLDVFDNGVFSIIEARSAGGLAVLSQIERGEIWLNLREQLLCFTLSSLALETADIFAREGDSHGSDLFKPLYLCLKNLNQVESDSKRYVCLIFFLVQLLRISGYDLLSEVSDENSIEARWFREMLERKVAFVPESKELIRDGLILLVETVQGIDGWELRTGEEVLSRLQKFTASSQQ